jgi:2-keto-3-deoxy-L-rhamnonate aldolase RhmA
MKPNRMKAKLAAGAPALGCSVMFPSPQLVEMLGFAGFDWVLLDCEHGSLSPADVELMCIAADASGITPIGRPRTNSVIDIQVLMDRGVAGVQVPHVNTAADARSAVASVKFGSAHGRGLAAGTRPDDWGFSGSAADYIKKTNDETVVIVQFEHAEALPNVDEILKVDGVDVFFVGPSDLSQSLGFPGNPAAPAVAQAIDATIAKIVRAGKTPGMPASTENVGKVIGQGVRYIYTHAPRLIGAGAKTFFEAAKR